MSFVFYDTETTGTNTTFDQILQFAAIHTDADLNELDRFESRCRLDPYTVPSPAALAVTRMTVEMITAPDLASHYEMICALRERLQEWCPTTFVGWNTLSFDEHLLRQAFYKCLHPPYLTNTGGNQRSDILKLAQCVEAFASDVLTVPRNQKGKRTYKLDHLAPANGFNHSNAHDAMADVEATIFICRLIKDRAPGAWERMMHCASKARVHSIVRENPVFVLHDYHGSLREYALTYVGEEMNGFASLAYDLSVEPAQLALLDETQLSMRLKKPPLPIRRIRSNVGPLVAPAVTGEPIGGLPYAKLIARAGSLRAQTEFVERLQRLSAREAADPSPHVEEQIYNGFACPADQQLMAQFHAAQWESRFAIAEQFRDQRFRILARRLIFTHQPECLPPEVRAGEAKARAVRVLGQDLPEPPWTTLGRAYQEAVVMEQECSDETRLVLTELRAFLDARRAEETAVLAAGTLCK